MAASVAGQATNWLPVVVGLIVAVLGGGGLVALFRARPEGSKILVDAAQGAVIVQSGVIDSLRADLNAARAEIITHRPKPVSTTSRTNRPARVSHSTAPLSRFSQSHRPWCLW